MIKTNNGMVELEGKFIDLIADFVAIARAMHRGVGAEFGDDNIKILLNDILQAAFEEDQGISVQMTRHAIINAFNKSKAEKEKCLRDA